LFICIPYYCNGEKSEGAATNQIVKNMTSKLTKVAEPKKEKSVNPSEYLLIEVVEFIGSLEDNYGSHNIT
jgi:hypothetical protein